MALQLLLARHHDEIMTGQRRVITAWELLDGSLATFLAPTRLTVGVAGSLVELIRDPRTHARLVAELHLPSGGEVLRLVKAPSDADQSAVPVTASGAPFRTIYDSRFPTDRTYATTIDASSAASERARIRPTLPLSMILRTDDEVGLLTLTDTAPQRSLLIRSPRFLAALRSWFELLWQDEATTSIEGRTAEALSAAQRQVLQLLAAGLNDDAIASAAGVSVRTIRRHISAVFDLLGVNSRFAAGVLAAKRGWI
jgi:DNA-binding CsgD family transcriptional regulator